MWQSQKTFSWGRDGWESKNKEQEIQGGKIRKDEAKYTKLRGIRGMWEVE